MILVVTVMGKQSVYMSMILLQVTIVLLKIIFLSQYFEMDNKGILLLLLQNKGRTGFFKQAKKAYPMFPLVEEKIKWDDYGELIRFVTRNMLFMAPRIKMIVNI